MNLASERRLIHAHFFFVDIVGLSNPASSTTSQIQKLEFLNNAISECAAFKGTPDDNKIVLPTGDGMAIGFLQGPNLPLELAIELHKRINEYNNKRLPIHSVKVRIGIHSGHVFLVNDLSGHKNIWGPGIIIARRVMDMGDESHILISAPVAQNLMEVYGNYYKYLHPLNKVLLKHQVQLTIYSAYSLNKGEEFGNKNMPQKIVEPLEVFLYPYIEVNLSILNPETMLVRHRRINEIHNQSDGLLSEVTNQIASEVEKSFDDLNVKIYDEEQKEMAITAVTTDRPTQKEFCTAFVRPLRPGQKKRYILEYELEEPDRYFENMFLANCKEFVVTLDYPEGCLIKNPRGYEIDPETGLETGPEDIPAQVEKKDGRVKVRWTTREGLRGQAFRFEW